MKRLLGIDVGTTGVRGGVYEASGRRVAEANVPCPRQVPAPGRAEADAEAWWSAVCAVCARLAQQTSLAGVEAVGVAGQAPTALLVDADGAPLRPAILWLDVRAAQEARELARALGPDLEAIGHNRAHAYYLGPKLAWLREHEPEALDRAAHVLQSHAFVALRLTGRAACDPSTAMLCAPLFDVRAGGWSERACAAAGVPLRLLPPIVRAHDVVGAVTAAAASATGLREGTPVVAGGGDFAASALGAGVVDPGRACLMLGTAGNLLMPVDTPARFDPRLINSHHVGCDRWLTLGGTLCGAALAWFRDAFAPGIAWETLEAEARGASPSPDLIFVPYLQGERTPIWDESARGVLDGLDLSHGRGHVLRALHEGIALGFRHCLAVAQERGLRYGEIAAADGAGRSPLLRQTIADALGVPLVWSGQDDATLAGAAILAGLGAAVLSSPPPDGACAWRTVDARHTPNPASHDRLSAAFERRLALVGAGRGRGQ